MHLVVPHLVVVHLVVPHLVVPHLVVLHPGGHVISDGGCTCPGDFSKAFGGALFGDAMLFATPTCLKI